MKGIQDISSRPSVYKIHLFPTLPFQYFPYLCAISIDLREPRRFKVTIFNDDFTTMEFVVKILTTVFFKSTMEAEALMMQVHKSESAVIGIYTYDIARSKVQKATRMAREEGFPLRLTVTPEEE